MTLKTAATVLAIAAATGCSAGPATTSNDEPSAAAQTGPAWAPSRELLLYFTLPDDLGEEFVVPVLHTIYADGSGGRTLPLAGFGATWSADGTRLLVSLHTDAGKPWSSAPAIVGADGRRPRLVRVPGLPDEVGLCHWTPDETDIVCGIEAGLVRIDPATATKTMLARGGENQVWDISPDGRIAFARQASNSDGIEDVELWTANVDGSGLHRLTEYGEVEGTYDLAGGSWIPDGSAIVAATPQGRLVKVDATTGELAEIPLDDYLFASRPAVSSDGTMIAFEAGTIDDHDLYVTPIDGGPVALVAGTHADEIRAAWRPGT